MTDMSASDETHGHGSDTGAFVKVVSVAQTMVYGHLTLTIVAVEVYENALLVTTLLRTPPAGPAFPVLTIVASDEVGTLYRCHSTAVRGQRQGDTYVFRREYVLTPSAPHTPQMLQLRVSELQWEEPRMDRDGIVIKRVRAEPASWSVDITLHGP
jgi:hypothetical protein